MYLILFNLEIVSYILCGIELGRVLEIDVGLRLK